MDLCLLLCCFDVQSDTLSYSFWTSACFPTALTSNPPRFLAPFGLPPCLPQLQHPIRHAFLLLLDLCLLPRSFNVQSVTLSCSFWTSAMPPTASTSNPSRFLAPFGFLPCLPQLQRPIRHAFLLLLDFHMLPAASTSNPTRFLTPFGPLPASPQLQRPIRHAFLLLLDFCLLPRSFNVQSDTLSCSFWTSACFPAALTSNPPRFLAPFGPLPVSPQLQRPIRHAFLLLLDFCLLPHSFNVQSTTVSCSFWTSAMPPAASTSNPSRFLALFGPLPASPQL